ncbi:protein PFC0760c-like [Papaver somniferum]|uniref:protein PFC0760c-like n=1 Tax=Papaver somniferum TaxID=3469 RepID=UPI000E7040BF|nr:protein PFC0760c-like [Papaver somniferum]
MVRKQKNGHAKAIIRQKKDDIEISQVGDMFKYFEPTIIQHTRDNESDEDEANNIDSDEEYENLVNNMLEEDDLLNDREDDENVQEEASEKEQELDDGENEIMQDEVQNEEYGPVNIHDPGNWNNIKINQYLRDCLVENGPVRRNNVDFIFPKDVEKRNFDYDHYSRYLSNGETEDRKWLVYSNVSDRVFCFCCKFFKQGGCNMQLDTNGSKDWHNMSAKLSRHETSTVHLNAMNKWKELEIRLSKNETIDKVDDSTGRGLFNKLEELLQNLNLDIRNIRGRGYDNGANMTGKNKGVQKRLLKTRGTAYSILTREIDNFELILGMVVWHRALLAVNSVSIKLQTEDMYLDDVVTKLKDLVSFFKEYRKDGFEEALEEAKTPAAFLNIEHVFYEVQVRKERSNLMK